MEQEIASQVVGLGGSTDFSLLSLFLRADFVVKSVILILIAASIYSWALIFDKYRFPTNEMWVITTIINVQNCLLNKSMVKM